MISTWIWDRLPGPWYLRALILAVVFVAIAFTLFEVVFPWVSVEFGLLDQTVEQVPDPA